MGTKTYSKLEKVAECNGAPIFEVVTHIEPEENYVFGGRWHDDLYKH